MKHLGDITKIDGANAPVVDVVIGGSPCQDLSIAGRREGLEGERSGLFMEQIRIIKEMRNEDERNGRAGVDIRPRYMVWENVPGAFSSNKGEDFRIVLEETAKVADENAVIPQPANGKWTTCGCIVGNGWSIAWRILDAQFWGVPQRRRRIALVADFGGQSAGEILFVRKGVSGHSEQGESKRKEASTDASRSIGANDSEGKSYTLKIRSGCEGGGKGALIQTEKSATLSTLQDQTLFQAVGCDMYNQDLTGDKSASIGTNCGLSTGRNGVLEVYDARGNGDGKTVCTITGDHCNRVTDYTPVCITCDEKMGNTYCWEEQANTLAARDYKQPQAVCYSIDQGGGKSSCVVNEEKAPTLTTTHDGSPAVCYDAKAVDCRNGTEDDINGALQSNSAHSLNGNNVCRVKYIVRRLTPLECERLQGYPDGWTLIGDPIEKVVEEFDEDTGKKIGEHIETEFYYTNSQGKRVKCTDSVRYKALGNSIALPPWKWVLKRICACYERDATMASLFDGIGGFPYLWEQLNGKGSCLWASEIEEFPIAVTKRRIGE